MSDKVQSGRTEPTRMRAFLTWAVRLADAGELTPSGFLIMARREGLCVERSNGKRTVLCTPWDPDWQDTATPAKPEVFRAPHDRYAQVSGRLALELEDEQRRPSWAVNCAAQHVLVRAPGIGQWKVPSMDLALQVRAWREAWPSRRLEAKNGCLLLLVPLPEWEAVFGHLWQGWSR